MVQYCCVVLFVLIFAIVTPTATSAEAKWPKTWRAVHLLDYNTDEALDELGKNLEPLAKQGINVIILEVDYNFAFKSHPELRRGTNPISQAGARRFAALCKKLGIHLILFKLMDEIIDAFQAEAFHVGMDEVFLLGSEKSPSTKGKDPGVLFAGAVNKIHEHLVRKRRVEMLMWGDRLIDGKKYELGEWEAAMNGTHTAIDTIPKDIIICDWHYEPRASYPSIPMFIEKGFRVLPTGWNKLDATKALIDYSRTHADPKMLGYLFTTWGVKKDALLGFEPLVEGLKLLRD